MPYTNAIFRVDPVAGSDAARTTLTPVTFSDSAGAVNANIAAHGLVTGAVVTVSLTTNWNGDWKITRVDANNFTLDTAVWSAGADNSGSVVPFGGQNWADAWLTLTSGATAARIAPGDVIRCAKSPAPVSIGSAQWTGGALEATQIPTSSTNATPVVITLNAHGYANGDFVQVTGHTVNTNANGVFRVANQTANTYELEGSVGNGVGGATGTMRRVNNRVVYLDTAQTANVSDCDAVWTGANSATASLITAAAGVREGDKAARITLPGAPATATRYGFFATGTLDLSAYQRLTLNFYNSAILLASRIKICLCSDVAGVTIVDTFLVPAMPVAARSHPLVLTKSGGGNLGASIQSVAIWSDTSAPPASFAATLDNIMVATTNGLNLTSLLSPTSAEQGGEWWAIQAIIGRNQRIVMIADPEVMTLPAASTNRGYYATPATNGVNATTTYQRETTKTLMTIAATTVAANTFNEGGTLAGGQITFSGGWNTASDSRDGETWLDGTGGANYAFAFTVGFVTLEGFCYARFSACINFGTSLLGGIIVKAMTATCCVSAVRVIGIIALQFTIERVVALACGLSGASLLSQAGALGVNVINDLVVKSCSGAGLAVTNGSGLRVLAAQLYNNASFGLSMTMGSVLRISGLVTQDNSQAISSTGPRSTAVLTDASLAEATEFSAISYSNACVYSRNHDLSGYDWQLADGGTCNQLATDFAAPATGKMWRLLTSATHRASNYPLDLVVKSIACAANETVTVKAMLKKAHASQVDGRLVCRGGQIAGVAANVTATLAANTTEQELTLTFTPTEAGVVDIEVWAEYVSGHAAVFIDRFTAISSAP